MTDGPHWVFKAGKTALLKFYGPIISNFLSRIKVCNPVLGQSFVEITAGLKVRSERLLISQARCKIDGDKSEDGENPI